MRARRSSGAPAGAAAGAGEGAGKLPQPTEPRHPPRRDRGTYGEGGEQPRGLHQSACTNGENGMVGAPQCPMEDRLLAQPRHDRSTEGGERAAKGAGLARLRHWATWGDQCLAVSYTGQASLPQAAQHRTSLCVHPKQPRVASACMHQMRDFAGPSCARYTTSRVLQEGRRMPTGRLSKKTPRAIPKSATFPTQAGPVQGSQIPALPSFEYNISQQRATTRNSAPVAAQLHVQLHCLQLEQLHRRRQDP